MVVGGGMAIVAVSDIIGGKLGNKLIDRDTSVEELAKVIPGDVRISLSALRCGSLWPWLRPADAKQRVYFAGCWWALSLLLLKVMAATAVMRFFYRPLVVKYSESLADRGLVRCIFYVGLFNTFLRSMFCFTKEMWSSGEDSGFHMHESGKEKDGVRRFSFDLYNWMRLDLEKMVDLLFDYTYNLGDAELASDQDIEVKTRFETTEDQYDIAAGASGTIVKRKNYGAVYEGSKVFVHFYGDGIKINNLSRSAAN